MVNCRQEWFTAALNSFTCSYESIALSAVMMMRQGTRKQLAVLFMMPAPLTGRVGGTVACECALRSAGTLLLRVRAPPSPSRPDGGPKT
ncbi:hypothetical protein PoB_002521600 [Plakobranchus ocellatus]|uniref:Uncharacterized protein n=1 Tax=Plakobranchus ocellatus TaxID=259542 RepID=A0AAV3ZW03_9GAST|nr:hypothetical protein PoB_002521600 [Plakobranchus ocellatus]